MVDENNDFETGWNNSSFVLKKDGRKRKGKKIKKIVPEKQPEFVIDISQVAKLIKLIKKRKIKSVNSIRFLELAMHTNFKGTKDFIIKTERFLDQYEYEEAAGISNKIVDFIKNMGLVKPREIIVEGKFKEIIE